MRITNKGGKKMERIMKKQELIDELSARTGFYKKDMSVVVNALADIVIEHFKLAEVDEPSELHIAPGVVLGGKRVPAHEAIDPRNRETIITPEKVIPFAIFKSSVRQKLYVKPKKRAKKVD